MVKSWEDAKPNHGEERVEVGVNLEPPRLSLADRVRRAGSAVPWLPIYVVAVSAVAAAASLSICLQGPDGVTDNLLLIEFGLGLPASFPGMLWRFFVNAVVYSVGFGDLQDLESGSGIRVWVAEILSWAGFTALIFAQAKIVRAMWRARKKK
jgi:hypothetical protein